VGRKAGRPATAKYTAKPQYNARLRPEFRRNRPQGGSKPVQVKKGPFWGRGAATDNDLVVCPTRVY
jgi:hypothetical protein